MSRAKRKIVCSERSVFWPCGACRENCRTDGIYCESCNQWFHTGCEMLAPEEFAMFQTEHVSYTCNRCFTQEADRPYNFRRGLARLKESLRYGKEHLRYSAKRESRLIRNFQYYRNPVISPHFVEIDRNAMALMDEFGLSDLGVPSMASANGNCLFNAVSVALSGHEDLATELRLRTAIDMALNGEIYKSRTDFNNLLLVSPEYDDCVASCCEDGGYSSVFTMISLSIVIGKPIKSVYPPVYGSDNLTHQILCTTFWSRGGADEVVTILWCRHGPVRNQWSPNHFVPVVPTDQTESDVPEDDMRSSTPMTGVKRRHDFSLENSSGRKFKVYRYHSKVQPLNLNMSEIPREETVTMHQAEEPENREDTSNDIQYKDDKGHMPSYNPDSVHDTSTHRTQTHRQEGQMEQSHADDGSMPPYVFDIESETDTPTPQSVNHVRFQEPCEDATSNTERTPTCIENENSAEEDAHDVEILPTPANIKKLPHSKCLSAEDAYRFINKREYIHDEVPAGNKSNSFFLVDNVRNLGRLAGKKKCEYFDDCGVWDYKQGRTTQTTYVLDGDSILVVCEKNGEYCTKRVVKGSTTWKPLSPQPTNDKVLVLRRNYSVSKTNSQFQRRVSFFTSKADTDTGSVALYQYVGQQPIHTLPHGHAKSSSRYVRTNPKTMEKISEKMQHQRPRDIYYDLKKDDSASCARDFAVIRNKKYNDRKRSNPTACRTNVADEILQVFSMLNHHPFVQTIIQHKDCVPSIICYTKEQIADLKYFLQHKKDQPVGIDRTFNLGSFYVTTLVYKNLRVVRKNNGEHPIFLGPVLLHKDATYKTYKSFLEHVATEIDSGIDQVELRISQELEFGSDEEKALTKAIDHVFPASDRYLCTKHLKDNLKHYMQNKIGMEKRERNQVMDSLFGAGQLTEAENTFNFESQADDLLRDVNEKYPAFSAYLTSKVIPNIRKHVFGPRRKHAHGYLWTNNNAESLNNILKNIVNWQPQHTAELIEKIYQCTDLHFLDYRSALHDDGNFRLVSEERPYLVSDPVWRCKSSEEKKKLFEAFLADSKRKAKEKYVCSSDGRFKVPTRAKKTAQKPGQSKRARNERAKKR